MTNTIKDYAFHIQVGTVTTTLLFLVSTVAYFVGVKKDMDATLNSVVVKYNHVDKWIDSVEEEQDSIKFENQKQDLVLVEIKTKLVNIEALLLDIKNQ